MPDRQVPFFDLYRELEVDPAASPEVISAAYRSIAKRFHPDVATDPKAGEARLKRANVAHEWLSDPVLRARYDAERPRRRSPGRAAPRAADHSPYGSTAGSGRPRPTGSTVGSSGARSSENTSPPPPPRPPHQEPTRTPVAPVPAPGAFPVRTIAAGALVLVGAVFVLSWIGRAPSIDTAVSSSTPAPAIATATPHRATPLPTRTASPTLHVPPSPSLPPLPTPVPQPTYILGDNETLADVAAVYGVCQDELALANGLSVDPYMQDLRAGMTLIIPESRWPDLRANALPLGRFADVDGLGKEIAVVRYEAVRQSGDQQAIDGHNFVRLFVRIRSAFADVSVSDSDFAVVTRQCRVYDETFYLHTDTIILWYDPHDVEHYSDRGWLASFEVPADETDGLFARWDANFAYRDPASDYPPLWSLR